MARCPVCNKGNVFGEQLVQSDSLLGLVCYQCQHCGTFRMNDEAASICSRLDDVAICLLLDWISDNNLSNKIPVINTMFVSGLLFGDGDRESDDRKVAACAY